uniref:Uncharacterized protein n=1 Tax=viral metagenome TaxID=1070528 RepID=A0A6C0H3X3_9ZZZZ
MVRHKTLRKKYYKNRENTIVKTAPRRRATKRKRVEHRVAGMLRRVLSFNRKQRDERPPSAGPSTARASPVGTILGDSNQRRDRIALPGPSTAPRSESRIFHNSVLIREGAAALERIYTEYPRIFDSTVSKYDTRDPFPIIIRNGPHMFEQVTTNLYETDYEKHIKPIIDILPKTETFHEDDVLEIMRRLHTSLKRFIRELETKADIMKGRTKNEAHKEQLMRSIRLLREMMVHSHADQFFTQHI